MLPSEGSDAGSIPAESTNLLVGRVFLPYLFKLSVKVFSGTDFDLLTHISQIKGGRWSCVRNFMMALFKHSHLSGVTETGYQPEEI